MKFKAIEIIKIFRELFFSFFGKALVHRSCQFDDRLSRITVLMSPCRISES